MTDTPWATNRGRTPFIRPEDPEPPDHIDFHKFMAAMTRFSDMHEQGYGMAEICDDLGIDLASALWVANRRASENNSAKDEKRQRELSSYWLDGFMTGMQIGIHNTEEEVRIVLETDGQHRQETEP